VVRRLSAGVLSCLLVLLSGLSASARLGPDIGWYPILQWSAGQPFDASAWTFEEGFLRNEELQYYAGRAPANFEVTPDGLRLTARKETVANPDYRKGAWNWRQSRAEAQYTSASLVSKEAWENVKVEVVAAVKGGNGAWPAIWLRAPNIRRFGEVDMMEQIGREPDMVHATVHYGETFSGRSAKTADRMILGLQGQDVTYTAILTPDLLRVSINGVAMMTMQRSRGIVGVRGLHQPFNLVINLALGGNWAGAVDEAALPATLTIKSIRIWEWRPGVAGVHSNVTASKD
jgi:beta-glucanase (GH16 family)